VRALRREGVPDAGLASSTPHARLQLMAEPFPSPKPNTAPIKPPQDNLKPMQAENDWTSTYGADMQVWKASRTEPIRHPVTRHGNNAVWASRKSLGLCNMGFVMGRALGKRIMSLISKRTGEKLLTVRASVQEFEGTSEQRRAFTPKAMSRSQPVKPLASTLSPHKGPFGGQSVAQAAYTPPVRPREKPTKTFFLGTPFFLAVAFAAHLKKLPPRSHRRARP
jgi:hypothetical protein